MSAYNAGMRIFVSLPIEAQDALRRLAVDEQRTPQQQAAHLILEALRERRLVHTADLDQSGRPA